jgi:hypothetical protein
MDIIKKIEGDMKDALKAGEKIRLQVLRHIRSAIKNAEIAKRAVLQEADVLKVIASELKKRKESIEAYIKGERKELAEQEEKEAKVLEEYMPKQLSDSELESLIKLKAEALGITDKKDFGRLMGAVMQDVSSRADGSRVKEHVQKFLE